MTIFTQLHKVVLPNDGNIPTQHIATLLGAICCVRLATVLRYVASACCDGSARALDLKGIFSQLQSENKLLTTLDQNLVTGAL